MWLSKSFGRYANIENNNDDDNDDDDDDNDDDDPCKNALTGPVKARYGMFTGMMVMTMMMMIFAKDTCTKFP